MCMSQFYSLVPPLLLPRCQPMSRRTHTHTHTYTHTHTLAHTHMSQAPILQECVWTNTQAMFDLLRWICYRVAACCSVLQRVAACCSVLQRCFVEFVSCTQQSCTGWRRLIGCLKLQVISRKRATNYRALLPKMTYEDEASYEPTPPCIGQCE